MAYNNIPNSIIKTVEKKYSAMSPEHLAIKNMAKARMSYDNIAGLLMLNPEMVKAELTGEPVLDEPTHQMLIKCVNTIVPLGLERGLFPCKDQALTTEILRVLVEILQMRQQILTLQNEDDSE